MLTLIVDAMEGRDVVTANVTGAYLNAEMDDYVLSHATGRGRRGPNVQHESHLPLTCTQEGQEQQECVVPTTGQSLVQICKKCFDVTLQQMGLELNPYNLCVACKCQD